MVNAIYNVYVDDYARHGETSCVLMDGDMCDIYGEAPGGSYMHGFLTIDIGRYGSPREMVVLGLHGKDRNVIICNRGMLEMQVHDLPIAAMRGMSTLPGLWFEDGNISKVQIPVHWDTLHILPGDKPGEDLHWGICD